MKGNGHKMQERIEWLETPNGRPLFLTPYENWLVAGHLITMSKYNEDKVGSTKETCERNCDISHGNIIRCGKRDMFDLFILYMLS